ncbi:MAG: ABC transporter permease [Pseudomonadota bacterium]
MLIKLASKSLNDRRSSVFLSFVAMAISVFVLMGVEYVRGQAKESFSNTVSGMDLIVGARTGQLNLLLYSVFRMGTPTNNIEWNSFLDVANNPDVAWAVPVSLGDSHQGYRVLGTTVDYFKHYSFGQKRQLEFREGRQFSATLDVVLGSEVAAQLNYKLGDKLVLAHGIGSTSFKVHEEQKFTVTGVLAPTGTPVDRTVHISLAGMEAIHEADSTDNAELEPDSITAIFVGLKTRFATFQLQRDIGDYKQEPLMAILPGVALSELWEMMSAIEGILQLISSLVLFAALMGMASMMAATIRERRNEIRLLRIVGASPMFLAVLFELEALLLASISITGGLLMLVAGVILAADFLSSNYGLFLAEISLTSQTLWLIALIYIATFIIAAIPALAAYREASQS